MSCPFATEPSMPGPPATTTRRAPLGGNLHRAYPPQITERYRIIEDPRQVRRILLRPELFTPDNALLTAIDLAPSALRILAAEKFFLPPVLASAGGQEHRRVRRIVAGFFSPAKVAAQRGFVQRRAREICEDLAAGTEREPVDLSARLAAPIPAEVMQRLSGVPVPPADLLKRFSRHSLELFWGWPDHQRQLELARTAAQFHAWLRQSVLQAIAAGDGNLYAELHREGVDTDRIRSLGYFLTIAGQETTALLIHTVLHTALDRDRWEQCAHNPHTAAQLVGAVLAAQSSVPTWRRVVARDTVCGGEQFLAGQQLVLQLSGGQLGREQDDSLAFGLGVHRCLGAGLARMQAEEVLRTAAQQLPGLTLTEPETPWLHLLSFQAPLTVPARLAAAGVRA